MFSPANAATNPDGVLLLALCRRDHADQVTSERLSLLRDRNARERLIELAVRSRVHGLVLTRAERSRHFAALPADAREELRDQLRLLRRRAAAMEIERDHIFSGLEKVAPGVVVLKGGALTGTTVYPDPVERDMADLDFLVDKRRVKSATRTLQALGYRMLDIPNVIWIYRRHHFHYAMVKTPTLRVELHWALERSVRSTLLDPVPFLRDAINRPDGLRVPAPEYIVLHLVLQCCHEGFRRLSRCVDIDRILTAETDFNWDRLIEAANLNLLSEGTAAVLQICRRLLDTPVPDHVINTMRPGWICRTHVAMIRPLESLFEETRAPGTDVVLQFWLLDSTGSRLRYLASLLAHDVTFPPTTAPPTLPERLIRFAKLCWLQIRIHGRFVLAMCSAAGRRQMRFWSRNASNSERR